MTRHRFIRLGAILLLAVAAISLSINLNVRAQILERAIPGDPVKVTGGRVAGNLPHNGVRAYLGIPFAAPPVGELRWKGPKPAPYWQGVRPATEFSAACYQTPYPRASRFCHAHQMLFVARSGDRATTVCATTE